MFKKHIIFQILYIRGSQTRSWSLPNTAHFACLLCLTHPFQLLELLLMSWWVESGVIDKGDMQMCSVGEAPGTSLGTPAVHYCSSSMPRLSQTCCFLQSPTFRQAQSALIGQLTQCIVIGWTPQARVGNVTPLTIIASFSFQSKYKDR